MHQSHGAKLCIHVGSFRNIGFYASISMPCASISGPMHTLCRPYAELNPTQTFCRTESYAELMQNLCRIQPYAERNPTQNLCRTQSYAELMQNSILCRTYAELNPMQNLCRTQSYAELMQNSMLCRVCLQSMSVNMPNSCRLTPYTNTHVDLQLTSTNAVYTT